MTGPFIQLRGRGPGISRIWVNMAIVAYIHESAHGETSVHFVVSPQEKQRHPLVGIGVDGTAEDILHTAGIISSNLQGQTEGQG